jgi:hypothetical protein
MTFAGGCCRPVVCSQSATPVWSAGPSSSTTEAPASGSSRGPKASTSDQNVGAGLKAVWYGAETFGKFVSLTRGAQPVSPPACVRLWRHWRHALRNFRRMTGPHDTCSYQA